MNHGSSGLLLLSLYLLLAVYFVPLYPSIGPETDVLNWAATTSLVERTTFDVSGAEKALRVKFENVERRGSAAYPLKPPGFAIVSAPVYAIARLFLGEGGIENLVAGWYILRLFLSTLPVLLLGFWLYSSEADSFSIGALLFATPLFPASLLFGPEAFIAVLVYLAFRVIFDFERIFPGRCFTAGVFLGFCLLCDLRAALPIAVFFLGLLFSGRRDLSRRLVFYLAGVLPFAIALSLYSWSIFGSFTALLPPAPGLPSLYSVYDAWFSPARGIFAYSPLLVFSLLAVFTSKSDGTLRFGVKYLLIASGLVSAVFASGHVSAYSIAASSTVFILPVFMDPLFDGEADEYSGLWRGFFFSVSLLMCSLPLLTYPFAPAALSYPHNSFWEPLLVNSGTYASTILDWWRIGGTWSLLFPAVVFLVILYAVFRTARRPLQFAGGALAAFLLIGNYMFFTDLEPQKAEPFIKEITRTHTQTAK